MKFLFPILILLLLACSQTENTPTLKPNLGKPSTKKETIPNPFAASNQLVLVTSPNDSMVTGTMRRYEKQGDTWLQVGQTHPVTLGKNGMGWGKGLHTQQTGYHRKEGDGKSPMGIFSFGTAFGYASKADIPSMQLEYEPLTASTQCIEDSQSAFYNQIVSDVQQKDWDSSDFMRRDDHVYKWGIFVNHNKPAEAGIGSCIFMHLWRTIDKPTVGCTGMSEESMLALLAWLSPKQNPRLVQLVESDYARFREQYDLPEVE